ncbi:hypothetical protein [Mesorhizobium sp. SP-1A]|uniref:hypothetical protein n=1 Tax=Mesorhizobium sp. SP-1A TaxID=3077840 RepID=UPI0028F723F9|nr:hypothetical protein [Mesorhizobium sp. SP-1A]
MSFNSITCDAGIKICKVPFTIYGPSAANGSAPVLASGDLGMGFAGSSVVALMMKEALAEIVSNLQAVPIFHDFGMDGIANVMFRGFKVIAKSISTALFEKAATCVVFAGYCEVEQRIRAFRMQLDKQNNASIVEVLHAVGDVEVFGSGEKAARVILPSNPSQKDFVNVLQQVIDDPNVHDVGGNIQYGGFKGRRFQPVGVAVLGDSPNGVHYWRGPLDLNGPDFDHANGLVLGFPCLDLITKPI